MASSSSKPCKRGAGGNIMFMCRCGATFCSEADFIKAWHLEHKRVCPHSEEIIREAAVGGPHGNKTGAAALCAAALNKVDASPATPSPVSGSDEPSAVGGDLPARPPAQPPVQKSLHFSMEEHRGSSFMGSDVAAVDSESVGGRSTGDGLSLADRRSSSCDCGGEPAEEERPSGSSSSAPRAGFRADDFLDAGKIGSGSYGSVRKVTHKTTGAVYAMKVIPKDLMAKHKLSDYLEREARTQAKLQHPHILRLLDRFEDADSVSLLLEYADGGSLFWALRRRGKFPENLAAPVFAQVAGALDHLHCHGIVHRDVKPENILMCEGGVAKLADFGWCAELARGSVRQTFCGTFDYLSPEMIHDEPHGAGVDVWAAGVLLYELLTGKPPFASRSQAECISRISRVDLVLPEAFPATAGDVCRRLLVRVPEKRLPLKEAIESPWVQQYMPPGGGERSGAAQQPPAVTSTPSPLKVSRRKGGSPAFTAGSASPGTTRVGDTPSSLATTPASASTATSSPHPSSACRAPPAVPPLPLVEGLVAFEPASVPAAAGPQPHEKSRIPFVPPLRLPSKDVSGFLPNKDLAGLLLPPPPLPKAYSNNSVGSEGSWSSSQRPSGLRALDTERDTAKSGSSGGGNAASPWLENGNYDAVRHFIRKGPMAKKHSSLADDLDKTVSVDLTFLQNRGSTGSTRSHGWADAREISPVRCSWNPASRATPTPSESERQPSAGEARPPPAPCRKELEEEELEIAPIVRTWCRTPVS